MTLPDVFGLVQPPADESGEGKVAYGYPTEESSGRANRHDSPYGPGPRDDLPLLKPPYGRVTALDLNNGTKLWSIANGDGPRDNPLLKDLNLPPLGTVGRPAPLLTKTLLFVGESSDAVDGAGVSGSAHFFAYNKSTGERLGITDIPAGTTGGPITYEVNGKQLIVVPIGSRDFGTAWIALGLR